MVFDVPGHVRMRVDTTAKTITIQVYALGTDGEPDVVIWEATKTAQDFTQADRQRLRGLLEASS